MQTKLHLDIDSHVVIQLGAELISDSEQALLELVKNAYDGDATRCTIVIDQEWTPPDDHEWYQHLMKASKGTGRVGRIVVEDNGSGLTELAVSSGWLMISASLKRPEDGAKSKTPLGRVPVGDKGLGRLATMRIGDVLYLCTKTKKERQTRTVGFAWSDFQSGAALQDVKVVAGSAAPLRGRDQGTNVEVLGLREPQYWDSETNIRGVIAKLSSLISPFRRLQNFQVNVRYNEQVRDLQALSADALNYASAKFVIEYGNGSLKFKAWFAKTLFRGQSGQSNKLQYEKLLSPENITLALDYFAKRPRLGDRKFKPLLGEPGGWLCSVEDEIAWTDIARDPKLPGAIDPGPFVAEIHYVLFNEPTKQSLQAAGIPVEMLQEMTSIGVFRDGFRVRMDDDWLEISKGVTSGGFFQLRPKNVIGFFEISNEHNPLLVEKSDREGFVDNAASRGFILLASRARKMANDSLDAIRTAYDDYKKSVANVTSDAKDVSDESAKETIRTKHSATSESLKLAKRRSQSILESLKSVGAEIATQSKLPGSAAMANVAGDLSDIANRLSEFQHLLDDAGTLVAQGMGAAEQVISSHEQLSDHNLRLIDAAAVGLSARGLTHEISAYVAQIDKGLASVRKAHKANPDKRLEDAIGRIAGAIRELRKTVASINPLLAGSRSLKDDFFAGDAVREFLELRASRLNEMNVMPRVIGGVGIKVRFARTRFNQVLENLLQNSLYWIDEHASTEAKVKRTIEIEIDKDGFTWWDGGRGVRDGIAESLFEPYVTDKPESRGQGIGLFLVTAFLGSEKCSISLLPETNSFGRRYKFRVDLRGAARK